MSGYLGAMTKNWFLGWQGSPQLPHCSCSVGYLTNQHDTVVGENPQNSNYLDEQS